MVTMDIPTIQSTVVIESRARALVRIERIEGGFSPVVYYEGRWNGRVGVIKGGVSLCIGDIGGENGQP